MKKLMLAALAMVFAVSLMAAQLDVVKQLLPDAGDVAQVFKLSAADTAKVQEKMASKAPVRPEYEIYVSKTGVVVIEEQMGKWGIIKTAVLIDPVTKKLRNFAVISMSEKRGAGIKTSNFIKQFEGKAAGDEYEVGKGIRAISGATVSSKAMVITVKRALIVYDLFLASAKK